MNKLLLASLLLIISPTFAKLILQDAQTRKLTQDLQPTLTPIADVRVTVETEERSDAQGRVLLKISDNDKGTFFFKELYKSGYVLISPTAEDVVAQRKFPLNKKAPVDIVLADKMELEKQKEKIANQHLGNYEARIHELELQIESEVDQVKRSELSNQLQELYDQYESIIERINEEADKLSKIDYLSLDEASRHSIELRKQGKAEELILHNTSLLPTDHEEQSLAMADVIKTSKQDMVDKRALAKYWGELYYNIAYGHQMKFNYKEVARWLKKCCDIDTENYMYKIEYADLLSDYLSAHEEALELYKDALGLAKAQLGEHSRHVTDIYTAMSECYIKLKMPEDALNCIKQAQVVNENFNTFKHPFGTIIYNNNVAGVYFAQAHYDQALEYYFKAVGPFEMHFGLFHPSVLTCYHNIGVCYDALNQPERALHYYLKLDRRYSNQQPKHHLSIAQNYICIALMYGKLKDYSNAHDYLSKALSLIEQHAASHPAKGVALYHVGRIHELQGEKEQAVTHYMLANNLFDSLTAHRHQEGIDVGISLGKLYMQAKEYDKALALYLGKLTQSERILGKHHLSTSILHHDAAQAYEHIGDTALALSHYKQSLAILNEIYDDGHQSSASCLMNLGQLSIQAEKYDDALIYFYNALIMRFSPSPDEQYLMADSYSGIASAYFHQGRYEESLAAYVDALAITEAILGEEHPFILDCYSNIGFVHYIQGEYDKALSFYTKALQLSQSSLEQAKINRLLGLVHEKQTNYQLALTHFERALMLHSEQEGNESDELIFTRYNIGKLLLLMKEEKKAHVYLSQAYDDAVRRFGETGAETLTIKQDLEQIKNP